MGKFQMNLWKKYITSIHKILQIVHLSFQQTHRRRYCLMLWCGEKQIKFHGWLYWWTESEFRFTLRRMDAVWWWGMQASVVPLGPVVLFCTLPFKLYLSRQFTVEFCVVLAKYWSCVTRHSGGHYSGDPHIKGVPLDFNKERWERSETNLETVSISEGTLQTEWW